MNPAPGTNDDETHPSFAEAALPHMRATVAISPA